MAPLETLGTVSYSTSIATLAVSLAVSTQYTNVTDGHRTRRHMQGLSGRLAGARCCPVGFSLMVIIVSRVVSTLLLGDITSALASADADRVYFGERLKAFKVFHHLRLLTL